MIKNILKMFNSNIIYNEPILNQERFEPSEWVKSINVQIKLLQDVYLKYCKIDPEYLTERLSQEIPSGYMRVAIPKLEFLAKQYGLNNPYSEIGILIEKVCELLMQERGIKLEFGYRWGRRAYFDSGAGIALIK